MKLEIGYNYNINVRKEIYRNDCFSPLKIMYLSDFHLNSYSGKVVNQIIQAIRYYDPSLILLGGDYVDTRNGFKHFEKLLSAIPIGKKVFAVAGNHDYFFGIKRIAQLIKHYSFYWIEKESLVTEVNGISIQVDGNYITSNKRKRNQLRILCLHNPKSLIDFAQYHLVFAGHLHGSQFVFWQNTKGLYPGRFFYKWNLLKKEIENCHLYISKGLGDTFPIRFNCKREIVLVDI